MRINEAYEHEPILPYQSEESCPLNGCNKVSTQCVDVTASVILSPTAVMGSPTDLSGQSHHHLRHQCRRNHVHRDYDPEGLCLHPGPLRHDHFYLRPHHHLRRELHRLRRLLRKAEQGPRPFRRGPFRVCA